MHLTQDINEDLPYPIEEKTRNINYVPPNSRPFSYRKCTKSPPSASVPKQWDNVLYCNPQIFLRLYESNQLPFWRDFEPIAMKLKWRISIDALNMEMCLPVFYSGLLLKQNPKLVNMCFKAIEDIYIHAPAGELAKAIHSCVLPLKNIFLVRDDQFLRRVFRLLMVLVAGGQVIVDELLRYFNPIFVNCYQFWLRYKSSSNAVNFQHYRDNSTYELVTELMNSIEKRCSSHLAIHAYELIKGVMPTYNSCVFTDRPIKQRLKRRPNRKHRCMVP